VKILITGGAGFIGSQIGYHLQSLGNEVTLLDNMSYGHYDNLTHNGTKIGNFVEKDVRALDSNDLRGIESVIHMAGIAPLPDCQIDPYNAMDNNLGGTINLLESCRLAGVKKVVFASTSAIYENCHKTPFCEDSVESEPNLIYAMSKRQCEMVCKSFCEVYGMNVVMLRFFNVYGPHQDFRRKQPPLMGYITKCLLEKEQPTFFSDGHQKRDYVYVDDLVAMVTTCLHRDDLSGEIFNVSSGCAYSVREIYDIFRKHFEGGHEPRFEKAVNFWDKYPRLFDGEYKISLDRIEKEVNKYSLGSYEKAESKLGWKPKVSLCEGIENIVKFAKGET
jgi:UDP-glucose 4-epimerase